jgi:hypothetical protein
MSRPGSILSSRRSRLVVVVSAVLFATGVVVLAADPPKLSSGWRDRDVRIDGLDEEWRDITQPVKGQHFAVGFLNDADALYFCLVTKDPNTLRQISRMGLVLWLDPAGGKKKTFGVRFPVTYGQPGANRRQEQPPPEPAAGEAPAGGQGTEPVGQRDIEILGPGKNDVRDLENGRSGVTGRYSVRGDLLVYELRVALRKGPDVPFAPDVDPGAALRVELQTPEWRGPVPMRRGPMIGIGMGRPGGPLYFPGADTALLKPLDIAAELRLATPPR